MAEYEDSKWMQLLRELDLPPEKYAAARLHLFGRDASYRQLMLGEDKDANRNIILLALGESLVHKGCMPACASVCGP